MLKFAFQIILFFILLVYSNRLAAQLLDDDKVIQFSGVALTGDSLKSVPYVNIRIAGTNRGAVSTYMGFFSFAAFKGDTIIFSSVGYRSSRFVIADTLTASRYSIVHLMQNDTILLTETAIYPWPNVEALEFAVINHRVPEDDYDRAMRNLAIEEMKERAANLSMDGAMNYRYQMQNVVDKSYYNGQFMPNQWLNPFAWAEFLKAWNEGKFKRKDKD